MSFSYERYDRRSSSNRRTTFGYWVPLVLTVTIATAGAAAWIWSERQDNDSEDDADLSYGEGGPGPVPPPPGGAEYKRGDAWSQSQGVETRHEETFMTRMSGAIRRTPSPSQMLDIAGKKVAAGVAAAGAVMGNALSSIREEERPGDYADHSRWSEEAARQSVDTRSGGAVFRGAAKGPLRPGLKRRVVAIVLSAEPTLEDLRDEEHSSYHHEHHSILSHLIPTNPERTELLVLVYAPQKSRRASSGAPPSLSSSYSAINVPSQGAGSEELTSMDPRPDVTPSLSATSIETPVYRDIHSQAARLVQKDTSIMPYSTQGGYVHMLRHLSPDVVYMTEGVAGENGTHVEALKNWVGQIIVVVGGDAGGLAGLVDTEDEGEGRSHKEGSPEKWWQRGDIVGLGKGVEVVDISRFDEDFERRVNGRE